MSAEPLEKTAGQSPVNKAAVSQSADAGGKVAEPEKDNMAKPELTVETGQPVEEDGKSEPELTTTTAFETISGQEDGPSKAVEDLQEEVANLKTKNEGLVETNEALLRTQEVLQSQKEEELRRSLSLMTEQLAAKDLQYNNMVREVERRTEAIKSCGEEIVKLRKNAALLESENSRLTGELELIRSNEEREMERISQLLREEVNLPTSIPDPILQQMRILAQNFGEQTEQLNRTTTELEKTNAELSRYMEKEEVYSDAQKVLAAQAKQLTKMEKLEGRLGAYKSTVSMQEKVIAKLESVIEGKIREEARRGPAAWAKAEIEDKRRSAELEKKLLEMSASFEEAKSVRDSLKSSNAELTKELDYAQQSLATLQRAYDELEKAPKGPDPEVAEKLKISELKLGAVMETMEQNAKDAQKEISQLKVKLFEYEMGEMGSMADDLSSVMGGMSRNTSLGSLPSLAR